MLDTRGVFITPIRDAFLNDIIWLSPVWFDVAVVLDLTLADFSRDLLGGPGAVEADARGS
jgi:hypothetical protein